MQFIWTVKASKLCNLRCRYCYEWPYLADPARIPLAGWKRILGAAKEYHMEQTRGDVAVAMTRFVWHGGEPLSLPVLYWRKVIGLQREILGREGTRLIPHRNDVQTNLFALSAGHLDLFAEEVTMVNVSFDGAPGTRVTKLGRHTEDTVIENMERLRQRNIRFGANVVLGGHTKDSLIDTYDLLKSAGASQMSVIPLIAADHFSNDDLFAISSPEVVAALEELYLHWSSDPEPLLVIPLNRYLRTVRLHQLNLTSVDFDRSEDGLQRFIVDTGGDLYMRVQR
ncbi:MAG: radical SAM protein, partial [Pyrinomonadaceae bacterium]|nr:radical SAM protein [Pyrinomonadaceae bacterium]